MKKVAVALHATDGFDINQVKNLENLDYIHVDVMDGKFVNNTMLNLDIFKALKKNFDIPIIVHMMVEDPLQYIDKIIDYIDAFLFHKEIKSPISKIIETVKTHKKKVGLVINPPTEVSSLHPYLDQVDLVLIMGVNPGWSGQKFIQSTIEKVNELSNYKKKFNFEIDVDGGVNLENALKLSNADILSSSSTILKAENPNQTIMLLKNSDKNP